MKTDTKLHNWHKSLNPCCNDIAEASCF